MADSHKNVVETVVTSAFASWANKKWFQVLFAAYMVIVPLLIIVSPLANKYLSRITTREAVTETLDEREAAKIEEHKVAFEQALQTYTQVKKIMETSLKPCDCDYMFLIEYHNGAENIMTGIQFCKFDISIEVGDDVYAKVDQNKFLNENVLKYDILFSPLLNNGGMIHKTTEEFGKLDPYLALQLQYINAKAYAITNLYDPDGKVFGSLLCVSVENDNMNCTEIYSVARRVESLMGKNKKEIKNIAQ